MQRAVGSWKTVFGLVLKFPPPLILPIFGFVTCDILPVFSIRLNYQTEYAGFPQQYKDNFSSAAWLGVYLSNFDTGSTPSSLHTERL